MNTATRTLLQKAVDTIDGLSGQQAMPDDFYEAPLAELKAALAKKEIPQPDPLNEIMKRVADLNGKLVLSRAESNGVPVIQCEITVEPRDQEPGWNPPATVSFCGHVWEAEWLLNDMPLTELIRHVWFGIEKHLPSESTNGKGS